MISIITPTYNREVLVQSTIRSILNQTYTDWELIIVDDGSTDNTEQVIQQFLTDKRITYIKKPNTGQPDSLNVGVSHAKGEFVVFLDSDDEAFPDWLETVSKHLDETTGIACAGAVRKFMDGRVIEEGLTCQKLFGEDIKVKFTCGSLFIRRSVFEAIGGYDTALKANIQTDLGIRLISYLRKTKLKVVSIEKNLVQINIHGGPRIRTSYDKVREGSIHFLNKHFDYIYKQDKQEISNICATIAFFSYKLKKRQESVQYLLKAIRYNPFRVRNYLRMVKYAFL